MTFRPPRQAQPGDYAKLIRAAGAKEPVSAILRSVTENGGAWAALLTTSGRPIDSVVADSVDEADPTALAAAFDALPKPVSATARVDGPDGQCASYRRTSPSSPFASTVSMLCLYEHHRGHMKRLFREFRGRRPPVRAS